MRELEEMGEEGDNFSWLYDGKAGLPSVEDWAKIEEKVKDASAFDVEGGEIYESLEKQNNENIAIPPDITERIEL